MKLGINNEENWKIHEHMEIKQHSPEQPMEQKRNKRENF